MAYEHTWSTATAEEIAEAAGAADLFVFRRVSARRFAHLGGAGRGAGWAGIVEITVDDEPLISSALAAGQVVRHGGPVAWHVVGPYYARSIVFVPVSDDVFVVFGATPVDDAPDPFAEVSDPELAELARLAGETLVEVAPAKRLADELEALSAVKELLHDPPASFDAALDRLVTHAADSLSCDIAVVYVPDGGRLRVCDRRPGRPPLDPEALPPVLAELAQRETFPACEQAAAADDLPEPFSTADGVLAYYLLELRHPRRGIVLLLHTDAAPARGFTQLCQSLGRRLVDAGEAILHQAILRDELQAQLERAEADARRDPLTGLPNRLAWIEAVTAAQRKGAVPATVVKLDCRGLKRVNELLGHRAGDRLLSSVAAILMECVRSGDIAARLGGDEFSLLLYDADEASAQLVIERIEQRIETLGGFAEIQVRLSIGASTAHEPDLEGAELDADARMLEAKRLGRVSAGESWLSDS